MGGFWDQSVDIKKAGKCLGKSSKFLFLNFIWMLFSLNKFSIFIPSISLDF